MRRLFAALALGLFAAVAIATPVAAGDTGARQCAPPHYHHGC
jgi:hypothetical protein